MEIAFKEIKLSQNIQNIIDGKMKKNVHVLDRKYLLQEKRGYWISDLISIKTQPIIIRHHRKDKTAQHGALSHCKRSYVTHCVTKKPTSDIIHKILKEMLLNKLRSRNYQNMVKCTPCLPKNRTLYYKQGTEIKQQQRRHFLLNGHLNCWS